MEYVNKGIAEEVTIDLGSRNNVQERQIPVIKLPDKQISQYVEEYSGEKIDWGGALTIFQKETGKPQIIISKNLPEKLQEVLLEHERAQLEVILNWTANGRPKHQILQLAHDIGVQAGTEKAKELGIIKLYKDFREKPHLNKNRF